MGFSKDYPNVPDWEFKSEGYQAGSKVKYKGNIFHANFWASEPGEGDANTNGWRFYDELYDLTSDTPTEKAKIIAYIPTWRKKEGFNYANGEMYQYITHGIISFLMFSEKKLGEFEPKSLEDVEAVLSDVVKTGHRNDAKILIALGGATDYGFLNLMTAIGNNPNNPLLDRVVNKVVDFVKSNKLDGVDLDLECWWDKNGDPSKDQGGRPKIDGPHPAGFALTLFAKRLKQAMPKKLVSAAVFGTSWYGNNYDPKLADHVDWLGIMTYDLTGSWNASPVGPHSALFKIRNKESSVHTQVFYQEFYLEEQQGEWPGGGAVDNPILSVEDTLWYWTNPLFVNWQGKGQNIPRNKIAAGVPIYGYDFAYGKEPDDLSGQVAPGYKSIRYKDILEQFPDAGTADNGNIKVKGSTARPPFISAPGKYPYAHNIYFETPDTAATKLKFLKDVGVQGVIIWELSNDVWEGSKSIIKTLYKKSGNPKKPSLPIKFSFRHWMGYYFHELRDRKLSEIALPGSHDAGMYKAYKCTGHGDDCNTQTQDSRIADQLSSGIRYFDLRPVYWEGLDSSYIKDAEADARTCRIACSRDPNSDPGCGARCTAELNQHKEFYKENKDPRFDTGHFNEAGVAGFQGCLGGSLDEVLGDVAKFAAAHPFELVILKFSHYLTRSPVADNTSKGFSEKIAKKLTDKVIDVLGTHLVKSNKKNVTLLDLTLEEILEKGSVIALFDDIKTDWPSGILKSDQLSIYDKYSDTNNSEKMADDQFKKLKDHKNDNELFLLSWTLTQDNDQAVACSINPDGSNSKSIEDLAKVANGKLEQVLDKKNTGGKLFNILYTDYCDTVPTKICLKANGLL